MLNFVKQRLLTYSEQMAEFDAREALRMWICQQEAGIRK